ncbi:MAG TPA: M24 family peptidase [Thermoanaerobaculia bacterium]
MKRALAPLILLVVLLAACRTTAPPPVPELQRNDIEASVWRRIRKERVEKLLPAAMRAAGVDAWAVFVRENANDPLAMHVGGENAGGTAAILFFLEGNRVRSVALSPAGEATALRDIALHDRVESIDRAADVFALTAAELRDAKRIAVNSGARPAADGLSYSQRRAFEEALGDASRLVPSEELVVRWLSVKLPEEVEIMRRAAIVTAQLEEEAYRAIVPGVTRDSDVAVYLKRRMRELGYDDAWAPEQNPNVNSGPDRGHSHATERVIQRGDIIQTDFGVKVGGVWCTDIQRFAYVLREGERTAPPDVLQRWENGKQGSRIALAAMKPGVRGYDVDAAQRAWMQAQGSEPVPWSTGHPVGYWAHDMGPALGGAQRTTPPAGDALRLLEPGQTFAFDGFFAWKLTGEETKTISVEEMAVVTATGAEYLMPPQEELILVGGRGRR